MDDTKQQIAGTLVQFPQTQGGVQPSQSSSDITGVTTVHVPPTGMAKEQEPFPSATIAPEFLKPSEQPVELEPDMKEAGVQETTQTPQIHEELQKVGVAATGTAAPLTVAPKTYSLKLPIDPEKAETLTKGSFFFKNPSSSLLWLALVVLRQLKMKKKEEESHAV